MKYHLQSVCGCLTGKGKEMSVVEYMVLEGFTEGCDILE